MELEDAEWNEMEGYTNNPRMEAKLSGIPEVSEMRFRKYEIGNSFLYVAEKDGYVRFYAWSGDGNDGGFSGRCYTITMEDGSEEVLKGPFSSRAGVVNKHTDVDCVKVHLMEGSGMVHVTKEVAEAIAYMTERSLVKEEKYDGDEIYYRFR